MVGNNVRLKVKDANLSNPVTASAASNSMDVSGTIAIEGSLLKRARH